MNKDELILENKRLSLLLKEYKDNNSFLLNTQKKYIKMAEEAGSKLKKVEHNYIRLSEEFEKFKKRV